MNSYSSARARLQLTYRAWSAPVSSYPSARARLQLPYRAWSAPVNSYSSVGARLQPPCSCSAQAISALEPSLFRVSGIDCRLGSHIVLRGMAGIISAKAIQLTSWRTISNISNDLAHLLTEKGIVSAIQAKFGDLKITTLRLFALIAETRTELKALLQDVPFELNPNGAGVLPADRIKHRVIVAQITDAWLEAPASSTS